MKFFINEANILEAKLKNNYLRLGFIYILVIDLIINSPIPIKGSSK
jgi:hypothetical protein